MDGFPCSPGKFWNDDVGAVTVDWVVLTAAIVGMGALAISSISDAAGTVGDAIVTGITTDEGE